MKKNCIIVFTLVFTAVISLSALTGCRDEKDKGIEIGFTDSRRNFVDNYIYAAIKTEKSTFDVDNISLDFYYGTSIPKLFWESGFNTYDEKYTPVCVAFFFPMSGSFYSSFDSDNYKNSEGYYKEISIEDFFSEDYKVASEGKSSLYGGAGTYIHTFKHSEKFVVPKEIFSSLPTSTLSDGTLQGHFGIFVCVIFYDNDENKYLTFNNDINEHIYSRNVSIGFTLLKNDKVRLFKRY